ncbi:hypothetical protein [Pseudogemmobacter faecipullorum]|uniref:Response regulator n=1 Tax=Pseudogemmobacter faecipullorum TaxID=2755041 RepID=A0ABS8CSF3_9RHOB|nr:hypothetical protein [Pseudogemmobacter faecipullorum]MCB5412330.1 hypothetical protein [Pseudogemmobacter faecipullorum]
MLRMFREPEPAPRPSDSSVVVRVPQTAGYRAPEGPSLKSSALVDKPLCPKGLILMCGEMGSLSRDLQDWSERMRAVVMVVSEERMNLDWLRDHAPRLDFLLVDSDYLDDTESTIDFCMQVRRAVPRLPLVLVSSEVRSHDFTCERMMACDVTLKPPLLHTALTLGVQAAYQNNAYYQQEGA